MRACTALALAALSVAVPITAVQLRRRPTAGEGNNSPLEGLTGASQSVSDVRPKPPPAMREADPLDSDRWAALGEPSQVGPEGAHTSVLMVNKPLVGLRALSKGDSDALCSDFACANVPKQFFLKAPGFKESPCVLSELANQAVNKEKLIKASGFSEPLKEFCREMYSLSNCLDTKGAVFDREIQMEKMYLTGVQCLRHQEYPYMCSCTPFGPPELTSNREAMMDYIIVPDGTRKPRPSHFPEHLLTKRESRLTGGDDATGGTTGANDMEDSTGSATGGKDAAVNVADAATGMTGPDEDAKLNIEAPALAQRSDRR